MSGESSFGASIGGVGGSSGKVSGFISKMNNDLSTTLSTLKQINSELKTATGMIGGVRGGGGQSFTGGGGTSLLPWMPSAGGVQPPGFTGNGMPLNGGNLGGGSRFGGLAASFGKVALGVAGLTYGMAPSATDAVSQRMAYHYGAMAMPGYNRTGLAKLTAASFSGAMTGLQDPALAAMVLAQRGMQSGVMGSMMRSAAGFSYMTGISNPQTAGAIAQTYNAQNSNRLMGLGIFAYGPGGKQASFDSIASQFYGRTLMGRRISSDQMQSSLAAGASGANIDAYFQDPTQNMMMREYFRQRAKWESSGHKGAFTMDAQSSGFKAQMKALGLDSDSNNPMLSSMRNVEGDFNKLKVSSDGLIAGFNKANDASRALSDLYTKAIEASGAMGQAALAAKGFTETFARTSSGAAVTGGVAGMAGGLLGGIGSLFGGLGSGIGRAAGGGLLNAAGRAMSTGVGVAASRLLAPVAAVTSAIQQGQAMQRVANGSGSFADQAATYFPGLGSGLVGIQNAWNAVTSIGSAASGGQGGPSGSPNAIGNAQRYAAGSGVGSGNLCDHFVGLVYGLAHSGYADANSHWAAIPSKYKHTGGTPPAGALVFWIGGRNGHVALSVGGGSVYSTDILRGGGNVDKVTIAYISKKWGNLRYAGWAVPYFGGKVFPMPGGNVAPGDGAQTGGRASGSMVQTVQSAANAIASAISLSTSGFSSNGGTTVTENMAAYGFGTGATVSLTRFVGQSGSAAAGTVGVNAASGQTPTGGTSGGVTGVPGGNPTYQGIDTGHNPIDRSKIIDNPRQNEAYAKSLAAARGWTGNQWLALRDIWMHESGFHIKSSDAYQGSSMVNGVPRTWGIPQANPSSKMADHGADYRTNALTQIKWGLDYIKSRYKDPIGAQYYAYHLAKGVHQSDGYGNYSKGAWQINRDQLAQIHQGEMILPSSLAQSVRDAIQNNMAGSSGGGGGGAGSVVINVTLANGGDGEAIRFARQVKTYMDGDASLATLGSM